MMFFVFDVESVGLEGEGFSYGWVLINSSGEELKSGGAFCPPHQAKGLLRGVDWVKQNWVIATLDEVVDPLALRDRFWAEWFETAHQPEQIYMAADVPFPVETRFLAACQDDHPDRNSVYPLIDIASVLLAAGMDPLGTYDRLPSEMPAHCPIADSRQSARILIEAMKKVGRL